MQLHLGEFQSGIFQSKQALSSVSQSHPSHFEAPLFVSSFKSKSIKNPFQEIERCSTFIGKDSFFIGNEIDLGEILVIFWMNNENRLLLLVKRWSLWGWWYQEPLLLGKELNVNLLLTRYFLVLVLNYNNGFFLIYWLEFWKLE